MDRRAKVELFEKMRREYEFGIGTIKGIAEKFGVHRRMVRQALKDAMPPERKQAVREKPKIGQVSAFIDEILISDRKLPRKQRHTALRIFQRVSKELSLDIGRSTVCRYVKKRKTEMGLVTTEIFVPQHYQPAVEAQIDWYEAIVEMNGQQQKVQVFSMRSMFSGAAFHCAYLRATQQAFFEAHQQAFQYFGGVFQLCRYDNLKAAVKKVVRGYTREETTRFIAFRSHWQFEGQFCRPGKEGAHEKGGVEGEAGYFRRNHFVPLLRVKDLIDLNEQLLSACYQDQQRLIGERQQKVGTLMLVEQSQLRSMPAEMFEISELSFPIIDSKGCIKVRNNWYSVGLAVGLKVKVKILPAYIEVWYEGKLVARHQRCYETGRLILELEHYLDVLEYKPGAFANSKPLEHWRVTGLWTTNFEQFWQHLQKRLGRQDGTRAMIELLLVGREKGYDKLKTAIDEAVNLACYDVAAVKHLLMASALAHQIVPACDIGSLTQYERPLPQLDNYDQLLEVLR